MNKRNRIILGAASVFLIVVIILVVILVSNNLTNKSKETPTTGAQGPYPGPRMTLVQKALEGQGAYPPPSTLNPEPTNTPGPIDSTPTPTTSGGLTEDQIQRIAVEEAKAAFDGHKAVFLDVRSSASFASSHIPGAISIPEAQIVERLDELNPEQWIIPYCS